MSTDVFSDKDNIRLEQTLSIRETLIAKLTEGGNIPYGKGDKEFLIQLLDGLDRTVLSKAKVKSADSANKTQQETAKLIGSVLARLDVASTGKRTVTPELNVDLESIDIIEGELNIGVETFDYDSIMDS